MYVARAAAVHSRIGNEDNNGPVCVRLRATNTRREQGRQSERGVGWEMGGVHVPRQTTAATLVQVRGTRVRTNTRTGQSGRSINVHNNTEAQLTIMAGSRGRCVDGLLAKPTVIVDCFLTC